MTLSAPLIPNTNTNPSKTHPISKHHKTFTSSKLPLGKSKKINRNFLSIIRKIAYPRQPSPTNQMISFLDLRKKREIPSLHCIPSIENMLSQQVIQEEGESKSSIQKGFSQELITENNCQMRVLYLCVLEKILSKLQHSTSISQRRKIIRGAWNILAKYAKDMDYRIFAGIGTGIEWGLLELINFDFRVSPKEMYRAEELLLDNHPSDTSVQFI